MSRDSAVPEPPFPNPPIHSILRMPQETTDEFDRKRAAALVWLSQYCARGRFVLGVSDLRDAARNNLAFSRQIDQIRSLVPSDEIARFFRGEG